MENKEKEIGFVKSMLCDSHDSNYWSSKRIVTLLAFIFCTIAFFGNMFFGVTVESFMFDTMTWVVLGGFGFTAAEKYVKE